MSLKHHLTELKKLTLCRDINFSIPVNYFFDHFSSTKACSQSTPYTTNHDFFKGLLNPALKRQGEGVTVTSLILLQIKAHYFIHGTAQLSNHHVAMLYYFADINVGMVMTTQIGGNTQYFRITGFEARGDLTGKTVFPTNTTLN